MGLAHEHELHRRRKSRNIGLGGVLAGFCLLIFILTFVKVETQDIRLPAGAATETGGN
ncbi:hypothetical protein KM176_02325 [Pseudooceanicola sp. CBS1P-1]|uniref:hypothetical protein n=1 Tax=Pseudooceanicola TaxID=1679449 RepID=UPI0019254540|nr:MULTISPECIES: hypothetical protein [Pseudooceanicola]MBT9382685.1 hypothetical protein [Pseudooceanicola endophyticus]